MTTDDRLFSVPSGYQIREVNLLRVGISGILSLIHAREGAANKTHTTETSSGHEMMQKAKKLRLTTGGKLLE